MIENRTFKKEDQLLALLKKQIDEKPLSENFAVWDADGTLWPEDANHVLMDYEQEEGLRDLADLFNPYYDQQNHRHKRCEKLIERQAGFHIEDFRFHCRSSLKKKPLHVFSFQRELMNYAKKRRMTVLIVTASIRWLVEEAVKMYELPVDEVLGLETTLEQKVITSEIVRPAPLAKSKAEVFLKYSQGKDCFLAGGNTPSDLPLLEKAQCPFVVHSARPGDENFSGESVLKEEALKKDWLLFERIAD